MLNAALSGGLYGRDTAAPIPPQFRRCGTTSGVGIPFTREMWLS